MNRLPLVLFFFLVDVAPAAAQPCAPTVIVKANGRSIPVEEALTRKQRVQGLMHRDHLKSGTCMWFVFDDDRVRSFWMRNTRISLDIVYVDRTGRIVRIVPRTQPYSERGLPSGEPARYVLEVNGGEAVKLGLFKGGFVQTCGTPGPKPS